MKFILTGCIGFIGGEVPSQCLRNPAITSIVVLSRRKFPDAVNGSTNLQVAIMKDINSYPDSVLNDLSGAHACIWCMGTTAGDKVLEYDYPIAFSNSFLTTLPGTKNKFRYLHLSGGSTERNQEKPLWSKQDMRPMKVIPLVLVPTTPNAHAYSSKGAAGDKMLGFSKTKENEGSLGDYDCESRIRLIEEWQ